MKVVLFLCAEKGLCNLHYRAVTAFRKAWWVCTDSTLGVLSGPAPLCFSMTLNKLTSTT
ncbi:hypothetical protein ACB092_09G019100 [Castanea dentata]